MAWRGRHDYHGRSFMRTDESAKVAPGAIARARIRYGAVAEERAREIWRAMVAARVEIAVVAAITALAAALRLWHLGTVPLGLHGDEAWTGIDARRVLREGWIGPYLISALGQPTGPLYFTALLFRFSPDSTLTLRLSMALFGIATIPLAYAAFSTMFHRTVGIFAALLLALMPWHLHLSRTGFMVQTWPFIEVAILWALFAALRRRSTILFVVAGALTGLGVYTYNAFLLFLPVIAVVLAWTFFRERTFDDRVRIVVHGAMFGLAALIVATPMIRYVDEHGGTYRYHERVVSVTHAAEWGQADNRGKVRLLWNRAREWGEGLVRGDRPDQGDGLATRGYPPVDPLTALLAGGGVAMAAWRWRRTESACLLAALALLPLGAILTTSDGLFRRTFGLAPIFAVLAALPLAWVWERLRGEPGRRRYAFAAIIAGLIALSGGKNVFDYFGPVQHTATMRFVFPYQMDAASRYMNGLAPGTLVYFYSDRWGFNYETRRFLAPSAEGVDRSRRFRTAGASGPLDLSADRSRTVAFVFLAEYFDQVDAVARLYPGGRMAETTRGGEMLYRAYELPAE